MIKKLKINTIEKIENGYICEYEIVGNREGKFKKDLEYHKTYRTFVRSPIELGRLILSMLNSEGD